MNFSKRDTTVIKGVAICLMLWHHLFTFPERLIDISFISLPFIGGNSLATSLGQFGKICVAMFALLSGYGTYLTGKKDNTDAMTGRRLLKMYKAFWSVFFVAVPISLLIGATRPDPLWEDMIYGALGLRFSYCNEWWFITPLAILIIMFPFIRRFVDREKGSFLTDVLWLVVINAFIQYVLPQLTKTPVLSKLDASFFWLELYTTLTLLPAFAIGCTLAKYDIFSKVRDHCGKNRLWIVASVGIIGALFLLHPFNWLLYDFINAAVFICCLLVLMDTAAGRAASRLFEILGNESTYLWLIHALFCYYWCQKLVFAPKYSILIFLWLLALSFVTAKLLRLFWKGVGRIYSRLSEIKL